MDTKVLPTPPLSRIKLLGQPYHGKLTGTTLRLPNGTDKVLANPGNYYGDCYKFEVPGVPPINLTPAEVAAEAAVGREWRQYALLSGRGRNYGELRIGEQAWLYVDPTGAIWRIACEQLDTDFLSVSMPLDGSPPPTKFPATADLTFTITRFGLVDPAQPAPEVRTITKTGQSLGGEFECDPLFWPGTTAFYNYMRSFPHNGTTRQWMPIAIEDITKTGRRCLLCVNRTAETYAWATSTGRGLPKSWIEVTVSGTGLEGITLSLSVIRVNGWTPPDISVSNTEISATVTRPWGTGMADSDYVITPPASGPSLSDGWVDTDVPVRVGATNHTTYYGWCAGGYYDSSDTLKWVEAGHVEYAANCAGSGSLTTSTSYEQYAHPIKVFSDRTEQQFDLLTCTNYSWGATLTFYETISNTVSMGGATVNFQLTYDLTVNGLASTNYDFDGGGGLNSGLTTYNTTVSGGAFGTYSWTGYADPPISFNAQFDVNTHAAVHVGGGETQHLGWFDMGVLYGAPMLREFDGLCLVRMTNKVYAVIALGTPLQHTSNLAPPFPTGQRVVAIGTPNGWITGDALATHSFASYHPVTGELAHGSTAVGWL